MKIYLFFISIIFITGCSAKYVSPQVGDRAQLRVVAPGFGGWAGLRIVYYDNGSCDSPYVFGIISGVGTTKSDVGTSIPKTKLTSENEYFDRYIKAGKTKMTIRGSYTTLVCTVPFEVNLEKDKNYELHHYWSDGKCHVNVREIGNTDSILVLNNNLDSPCYSGFAGVGL